jgi:AraC-like DNA-binding protein/mannose-6-phosphate isomerase-like protein (cupin superfamily)
MIVVTDDKQRQSVFAFEKLSLCRYPVYLNKWIYTSRHESSIHNHDYPQLWYCADGRYLHQVGDQVYECRKGSVIIVPTGVFHKFLIPEGECSQLLSLEVMFDIFLDSPYHRYMNAISALFLHPLASEVGCAFPTHLVLDRETQKVFEECISWLSLLSFTRPGTVDKTEILEKLEELFSLPELALPDEYREKAMHLVESNLNPMLKALRYLNDHYHEKLVEQMMLPSIGISHTGLYRFFKSYTGYTFAQYRQILRVKHAHIYLARTTYSISYISDVCGFCDTQYMSRTYKKYTGRSPREARVCFYEMYKDDGRIHSV